MNLRASDVVNAGYRLAGLAGRSTDAFERLVAAFAENASVVDDGVLLATNRAEVRTYLNEFFEQRIALNYLWNVREERGSVVTVDWTITGSHPSGGVLATSGTDTITLTDDGKVAELRIVRN